MNIIIRMSDTLIKEAEVIHHTILQYSLTENANTSILLNFCSNVAAALDTCGRVIKKESENAKVGLSKLVQF